MPQYPDGTEIHKAEWDRLIQSIPTSYAIWKNGSTYRAECNLSGGTDYSGTASQVTQNVMLDNSKIHFGKGTFNFDMPISILNKKNIYIEGEGRESTILKFNDGVAGFNFTGSGTMREITFKNLTIVGKNALLLGFSKVDDVWIENVELVGGGKTGAQIPDNATMNIVESNGYVIIGLLIWDGGAVYTGYQPLNNGLFIYTSGDIKMSHSVFTGCVWEGVHLSNSAAKIVLCEFNNNDRHGLAFDTCAGIHVLDSAFVYNGWCGLLIADALGYSCTGHVIIGNQFQQNGRLAPYDALQITCPISVVSYVNIIGNTFWWNPAYGIGLYDTTNHVSIISNLFNANTAGAITKDLSVTDVTIFGNSGYNPVGNVATPYPVATGYITDVAAAQAFPTTHTDYTISDSPKLITIYGGTVSAILVDGVATGLTSGAFQLNPGQILHVDWSEQPSSSVYAQ